MFQILLANILTENWMPISAGVGLTGMGLGGYLAADAVKDRWRGFKKKLQQGAVVLIREGYDILGNFILSAITHNWGDCLDGISELVTAMSTKEGRLDHFGKISKKHAIELADHPVHGPDILQIYINALPALAERHPTLVSKVRTAVDAVEKQQAADLVGKVAAADAVDNLKKSS